MTKRKIVLFTSALERTTDLNKAAYFWMAVKEEGDLTIHEGRIETDEDREALRELLKEAELETGETEKADGLLPLYLEVYGRDLGDFEVAKAGWHLGAKRYRKKRALAGIVGHEEWPEYEGLTKEESRRLNDWLWYQVYTQKSLSLTKLVSGVSEKFGLPYSNAERIVRTELANIFNKMREWAYETETQVAKFVWVAPPDACEKCTEVAKRSAAGVSIARLKRLIKEVGESQAREWTVHPNCRCTFVRKYGRQRGWERV
ncbi:MAG: hypothetical protein NZ957_05890 [Thaumarchaeota archaeon]|nr:hypothetical protein [Candidatus Calditenuaceae archaeon]